MGTELGTELVVRLHQPKRAQGRERKMTRGTADE